MIIGVVVWSLGACIFLLIGRSCWKAKEATGFFTGVKRPKVKDVIAYNHAVAKIWYAFATILEIIGVPLLFIQQNSPIALLIIFAIFLMVIAMIVTYIKVEAKYRA